jgi:hypothetical protein
MQLPVYLKLPSLHRHQLHHVTRQRPHSLQQRRDFPSVRNGFCAVTAVLEGILVTLRSPGRRSAVHAAAAVRHRWRLTGSPAPGSPTGCQHCSDDGSAAFIDGYMLNRDTLFSAGPVSLERLDLSGKGPGELVESPLRTILLRDVVHLSETASEGHGCHVNGGHLGCQHGFPGRDAANAVS